MEEKLNYSKYKNLNLPGQYWVAILVTFLVLWFSPLLLFRLSLFDFTTVILATIPALVIISYTFLKKNESFDLVHPLNFILIAILIGTTFQSYFLVSSAGSYRREFLMYGEHSSFLLFPAFVIAISTAILVLGFSLKIRPLALHNYSRLFRTDNWNNTKLWISLIFMVIAGLLGMYSLLQKTGLQEIALDTISEKRRDYADPYTRISYGYERWVAFLIRFAFYFALTYLAQSKKSVFSVLGIFTVILFFLALLFPFMTSARSGIVYIFFNTVIIWYCFRGFPFKLVSIGIPLLLILFNVMLLLRKNAVESESDIVNNTSIETIAETFAGSGNMISLATTGHILKRVPDRGGYVWGQSFYSWIFLPIPRTMWLNKPPVTAGALLKKEIFLEETDKIMGGGHPPAIIGELYWNFSWPGLILGMFLVGRFLKLFYVSFYPYIKVNKNATLIYVAILLNLCFVFLSASVSQGIGTIMMNLIPIVLVLYFINK